MGKLCILKKYTKISIQITIPTELIGSLPRTNALLEGQQAFKSGHISLNHLEKLQDQAVRQTLSDLEKTGPGQVTDGEQAKPSFLVYPYVFESVFLFYKY
jgi:5-methyltetrahydropteroyltriglutamate--homocysteine methyltransferase